MKKTTLLVCLSLFGLTGYCQKLTIPIQELVIPEPEYKGNFLLG